MLFASEALSVGLLRQKEYTVRVCRAYNDWAWETFADFNDRLAERDDTLEKWKSAYAEAASVARTKEAERAKFEGDAKTFRSRTQSCEVKNGELVKVSNEVVKKYEAMNPLEKVLDHDPVFGLQRVNHQNEAQDFRDKILDQKAKP